MPPDSIITTNRNQPFWTLVCETCFANAGKSAGPISAHEMRRQLGLKNYRPVWEMMHKIRAAMGQRDDRYGLEGMVEFDEGYFSTPIKKGTKLKQGEGSPRKANVAVMAEATPLENLATGKKSSQCRYFKMKVLPSQKVVAINEVVESNLDERSIVFSDKANTYVDITEYVEGHVTEYSDKNTCKSTLNPHYSWRDHLS